MISKKLCVLFSLSFLFTAVWLSAGEIASNAIDREKLAGELSQKLNKLGSFKADYQVIGSSDTTINFTILFSDRQKYCLIKFFSLQVAVPDNYIISDFSRLKAGEWELLTVKGMRGRKYKIPFSDIIQRLGNPIGFAFFMAREFCLEAKVDPAFTNLKTCVPSLSLELEKTNLFCLAGFNAGRKGLLASWLRPDILKSATNVFESSDSVQLSYADHRTVVIDRKTGLLLRDSWLDPATSVEWKIVMLTNSSISSREPYSSVIPNFDKIKMLDVPSREFYPFSPLIEQHLLTGLGQNLSSVTNFDELLQTHSAEMAIAMGAAVRQSVRTNHVPIDRDSAVRFRDKVLFPSYLQFTKEFPFEGRNLTFFTFLDRFLAAAEAHPDKLKSPEQEAAAEKRKTELLESIAELPDDAQKPLKKLFDICIPAMVDAGEVEGFAQMVKEVKALGPPDPR